MSVISRSTDRLSGKKACTAHLNLNSKLKCMIMDNRHACIILQQVQNEMQSLQLTQLLLANYNKLTVTAWLLLAFLAMAKE